jgi:hypothetical protein
MVRDLLWGPKNIMTGRVTFFRFEVLILTNLFSQTNKSDVKI